VKGDCHIFLDSTITWVCFE